MPLRKIYIITLLEGFTTLAIQMIVLRLAIPVVGSSIVLTSIFLGVILLALSCGYRYGGILADATKTNTKTNNEYDLRKILGRRLIISGVWYLMMVLPWMRDSLQWLIHQIGSVEWSLFLIACGFFFVPIFLASQTIPLLTELIPLESKGKSAGTIFFISTIGSFLGSIVTTLFLFPLLGLKVTGILVSLVLIGLGFLSLQLKVESRKKLYIGVLLVLGIFCTLYVMFSTKKYIYATDTPYQEIVVTTGSRSGKDMRYFLMNRAYASGFDPDAKQSPFHYLRHIMDMTKILQPKSVLVIGSAGFVYPYEIAKLSYVEHIDAIDIDPAVKELAEKYLIQEQLSSKITFIPRSARGVLRALIEQKKYYDLIVVDAFIGKSVPAELVTTEFVSDMKQLSDTILWNMLLDTGLASDFSQRFLATVYDVTQSVFTYDSIGGKDSHELTNMIVSSKQLPNYQPFISDTQKKIHLYSDDKSSAEMDSARVLKQ